MNRYNPKNIEPKWQRIWQETNVYTTNFESKKTPYVAMSMFNYPSGAGIHVGHAMNYTISDVKARFKRQQGFESYHPVGWDSFGLPAENYAIKAGVSPQESMAKIIPDYHLQYQAMGWSNDWEKEITTSTPEYYKWTQWIFIKMHEHGLAYQDSRWQWWCNKCQTVLANEQVIDGKCWRHDGKDDPVVEKKEVKQWFFKITDYADELLASTDNLDWTEHVKLAQKNWIGKSEGAEIIFQIKDSDEKITVFTTRADTLYGATFMVLAPDHELVKEIAGSSVTQKVNEYVKKTAKKTEVERQASKDKTGVFLEAYAINPVNNQEIPIYIADYVLSSYGTGAIMAVPAHDERDEEFAKNYSIAIVHVVDEAQNLINSGKYTGLSTMEAKQKIITDLSSNGQAVSKINYRMRDWSISRQRYWGAPIPVVNCQDCGTVVLQENDLPVILPELTDFAPSGDGRSALARATDWLVTKCPTCGGKAERETDTMDTYVCSSWYMFRYLDPHNQSKIFESEVANKWMPIDFYNGGDHATAHLLYARFLTKFFNKIGLTEETEPFKQMLFNGKVTANDGSAFSKTLGNGPDPLEIIDTGYGADALRMYLMFAAPLEMGARWDAQGVPGTHRFLSRVWNLSQEYLTLPDVQLNDNEVKNILQITHKVIKKVTDDIEDNRYNTAIAACMEAINSLYLFKVSLSFGKHDIWKQAFETIFMCIAPFAPHIADELWQQFGHSDSIHKDHWPKLDEQYLVGDTMIIVVQVNGKVRAQLSLPRDATNEQTITAAKADSHVQEYIKDKEVKREIYIQGKLLNLVV
jgi:leucyl-tRNA synthetase